MKNKIITSAIVLSALVGLSLAGSTFAATTQVNPGQRGFGGSGQFQGGTRPQMPGVFGTVSAINGTTLTVASKGFSPNTATTTYSVDASNATVMVNGATSTLSAIAVGNTVMVSGTVSGTSVTATKINVGGMDLGRGNGQNPKQDFNSRNASSTLQRKNASSSLPEGNGQPIIGGTVSAISGTSITITNKSNTSYTIDASSATVTKGSSTSAVSNIAVGDSILVQGTINGTSVTATTITDQGAVSADNSSSTKPAQESFLGGIGNFFAKLFGF